MKFKNRRIVFSLWILIATLILHLAIPLVYRVSIEQVKSSQHEFIASATLTSQSEEIRIPESLFKERFDADEKELELDGMRYDVISYSRSGNAIICRVLKDEREQQLLNGISKMAHSGPLECKYHLWFPVFHEIPCSASFLKPYFKEIPHVNPSDDFWRSCISMDNVSPPPDRNSTCC